MRVSKTSFLDHVKWLRKASQVANAEFLVAGDTLQALVRQGSRQVVLHPRFLTPAGQELLVTPQLHDATEAFLGWLPYSSRHLPVAGDRPAFRRLARSLGLKAPEIFEDPAAAKGDLILTKAGSSPRRNVAGPYRSRAGHPADLATGEQYEQFIPGDLLRVWYWNGTAICAERHSTPSVVGDGVSTVRELILRRAHEGKLLSDAHRAVLLARSEMVLRHHGATLSTVLQRDARQRVEVGYGASPPIAPEDLQLVDLTEEPGPTWRPMVREAGRSVAGALPEAIRSSILFTLDAVLDDDDRISLLEMNGNPAVHPIAYPAMIAAMFSAAPHDKSSPVQPSA